MTIKATWNPRLFDRAFNAAWEMQTLETLGRGEMHMLYMGKRYAGTVRVRYPVPHGPQTLADFSIEMLRAAYRTGCMKAVKADVETNQRTCFATALKQAGEA